MDGWLISSVCLEGRWGGLGIGVEWSGDWES